MPQVSGSFEVKLTPQQSGDKSADAVVGLMSIAKQFHGPLQATSSGHMLAVGTEVKGSAGYVAMERVSGSLQGRDGSFALAAQRQHAPGRALAVGHRGARFRHRRADWHQRQPGHTR